MILSTLLKRIWCIDNGSEYLIGARKIVYFREFGHNLYRLLYLGTCRIYQEKRMQLQLPDGSDFSTGEDVFSKLLPKLNFRSLDFSQTELFMKNPSVIISFNYLVKLPKAFFRINSALIQNSA